MIVKYQMIVDIPGQETATIMCPNKEYLAEQLRLTYLYSQAYGVPVSVEVEELLLDDQCLN